jgi:sec-independent protein translocase protein TatB
MPLPSGFEWIVILVIALLILGPGKLPDVAAAVGKSLREFRKASTDVQEAVKLETSPQPASAPAQPAPSPTAATTPPPAPNTLAASAEPNVLTSSAPVSGESGQPAEATPQVSAATPSDGSPTATG